MPVAPLAADKPKIVFYGAMMAIQNFGFFLMYYPLFGAVPALKNAAGADECETLRFWIGLFAIDCFVESFCCVWMAMGGYIGDNFWFKFGWLLHLVVALPYCVCTVGIRATHDAQIPVHSVLSAPLTPLHRVSYRLAYWCWWEPDGMYNPALTVASIVQNPSSASAGLLAILGQVAGAAYASPEPLSRSHRG